MDRTPKGNLQHRDDYRLLCVIDRYFKKDDNQQDLMTPMKVFTKTLFFPGLLIICLSGCSEFIERSVEGRKVVLLAPADSVKTNKYTVDFWWEPVEDALNYRLQIVNPSFDSIASLVADTAVTGTKFSINLDPGKYSWRLRAENGSSVSLYTQRTMVIHESSIINQKVRLLAPVNNSLSNNSRTTFRWDGIFSSSIYRLQVDTANFSNDASLVLNTVTPDIEYTMNLAKSQKYHWRVRAESDTVVSAWSEIYQFTFDNITPDQVKLTLPANNAAAMSPVTFTWEAVTGARNYEISLFKSDSVSLYNNNFPLITNSNNFVFNGGLFNETIIWKVRARDEAGNFGEYSAIRKVTIQ